MKVTKSTVQITFELAALIDFFEAVYRCYVADCSFDFLSVSEQYELVKFLEATAETCGYKGVNCNVNNEKDKA